MIPTRIHGILDYLIGVALIAAPWLFGFADGGAETWIPVILGAGSIIYSLLTDYELGIAGVLSMRAHLMMDVLGGLLLAASPWLFDFDERVFGPHLAVGLVMVLSGLMTSRHPSRSANDKRVDPGNRVDNRSRQTVTGHR